MQIKQQNHSERAVSFKKIPLPEGASLKLHTSLNSKKLEEGRVLRATIEKDLGNGRYQLKTSDGQRIEADISPRLPVHARIKFTVSNKTGEATLKEIQLPQPPQQGAQGAAQAQNNSTSRSVNNGAPAPDTSIAEKVATTKTTSTVSETQTNTNMPLTTQSTKNTAKDSQHPIQDILPHSSQSGKNAQNTQQIDLKAISFVRMLSSVLNTSRVQTVEIMDQKIATSMLLKAQETPSSFNNQTSTTHTPTPASSLGEVTATKAPQPVTVQYLGKVSSSLTAEGTQTIILSEKRVIPQGSNQEARILPTNTQTPTTPLEKNVSLTIQPTQFPLTKGENIQLTIQKPHLGQALEFKGTGADKLSANLSTAPAPSTPASAHSTLPPRVWNQVSFTLAPQNLGGKTAIDQGAALKVGQVYEGIVISPQTEGAGQKEQTTLQLNNGIKINIPSTSTLEGQTNVTIKITADGVAEVLKLTTHSQDSSGQGYEGMGGKKAAHTTAPHTNTEQRIPFKADTLHVGIVSSQGDKGRHTLSFAEGVRLDITSPKPLPLGAHLTIHVTKEGEVNVVNITLPSNVQKVEALTSFNQHWQNLEQGIKALQHSHPTLGNELLKSVPTLGVNFLGSFATFMSAVQQADIHTFSNKEAVTVLKGLGIDLDSDVRNLHTLQQKSDTPDQWKALLFPYIQNEGGDMQQGSFFWKKTETESEQKHLRFVINMTFTSLGTTQLDGYMSDHTVNFKLRSQKTLPQEQQKELREIVQQTLQAFDLQGDILFEQVDNFNVDPFHDMLKERKKYEVSI